MLTAFSGSGIQSVNPASANCAGSLQAAIWIDLFDPSHEETHAVEAALGIRLPTRTEVQEIEVSSRLYVEGQTMFMTATVMVQADTRHPETTPRNFRVSAAAIGDVAVCRADAFYHFPAQVSEDT